MDRSERADRGRQDRRVDSRARSEGARRLSANGGRRRETVSVVIPTYQAGDLLPDCLASVAWADEIVVVDSGSTDGTLELCAAYPQCRLLQHDDYIFAKVNHGVDAATSDWVMRLDTDERVTPELASELDELLREAPPEVSGFECRERPIILGRELRHGFGSPHYRQMVFRRGRARYPVRSEHEALDTSGEWRRTKHGYLHLNYKTVGQYLDKMGYYTDRDVERAELPARPPRSASGLLATLRAFYLYYLKRRGYRDGWIGLLDAAMRGFYQFVYWAKLRERWQREKGGSP